MLPECSKYLPHPERLRNFAQFPLFHAGAILLSTPARHLRSQRSMGLLTRSLFNLLVQHLARCVTYDFWDFAGTAEWPSGECIMRLLIREQRERTVRCPFFILFMDETQPTFPSGVINPFRSPF